MEGDDQLTSLAIVREEGGWREGGSDSPSSLTTDSCTFLGH